MPSLRFGGFEFDLTSRELRKGRTRLRVPDQSLAILAMLLERPGELVTREAIQARLWPNGTVVEFEHSVNSAIKRLRQALLDTATTPRFVETLPRKGYRFIGTLEPETDESAGLMPGTIISHYRILAECGRGAMGVVYKAEDTNLGRMVALKFLPEELATHPPALERLRREARMIAALNHPGICTMYELGESSGRVFLVMEFLEGETLRAHGKLSESEVIDIAVQVAKALEAAHAQGMIHRDIKPDNLFLTKQGVVKLMDFGLAKPLEEEGGAAAQSSVTGTSGYMSPEQARGEALDARSDIYSLGKVLEELAVDPPPKKLVPILTKALADDPAMRWQSAGDLRGALELPRRKSEPRTALLVGLAAATLVAVALTWFLLHRPPKPSVELTQKRLTFNSSEDSVQSATISPDGKYLAYSDRTGIKVKLLSTGDERLIPRPAGIRADVFWWIDSWFPDSAQLLTEANDKVGGRRSIWTVSVVGQFPPRELREGASGFGVSPDGTHIVFSLLGAPGLHRDLWVMDSQGENPQKVLSISEENEWLRWADWSPDGQRLVYIRLHRSSNRFQWSIETCDLKGANRTTVVPDTNLFLGGFLWLPDGRIIYTIQESLIPNDVNVWQIAVDNRTGAPTGKPKRITQWAESYLSDLSASADGKRLVIISRTFQAQGYLGELAAGGTRMNPPHRLTNNEASDQPTGWTPDSKAVLFNSNRNGTVGIYKQGISQETSEPLVTGPQDVAGPLISADGTWILFRESPRTSTNFAPPPQRLMRIPVSGGTPQFVLELRNWVGIWCAKAPATRCVIFEISQDRKQFTITAFDPLKGRGQVLRTIENNPSKIYDHPALSPDGSTVAVSRGFEPEIHIRLLSLPGGFDRELTVKGWPNITGLNWSPDGKGFYCGSVSSQGGTLLYVDLMGNARVLWQHKGGEGPIWGVPSPDGRYLAIRAAVTNSNVWMLEGF